MEKPSSRLAYLLRVYSEGTFTEVQRKELMEMVREPRNAAELNALIEEAIKNGHADKELSLLKADEIFNNVISATQETVILPISAPKRWKWIAAAFIVILLTAAAGYFVYENKRHTKEIIPGKNTFSEKIIPPATNKATLTLTDGSVITLDNSGNDTLAIQQGNTNIINLKDGSILYKPGTPNNEAISYNTISTPKGGRYHIILPDSTNVWLNAASTLTFPTVFSGPKRNVDLSGEAYFEVAPNKSQPFQIGVHQSVVTALGTDFNINAYSDEKEISTTLLKGSVKFSLNDKEQLLIPGQQTICIPGDNFIRVQNADITQAMSWKNGFFEFENLELPVIMRQIGRWYDVDIEYRQINTELKLGSGISRNLSLQDLQKLMEANGVHFTIEGRKIIVGH